jgi:hypothetical protein
VASKEPAQKPARKALKTESRLRQVEREAKAHLRNLEKKAQARMLAEVRRQEKLALEFEREQQRLARLALDQENTRKQRQRRLERLREAEREQAEAFALVERQRESKAERVATALAEPGETPVQEEPGPVAAAPAAAGDPPGFVPPTARAPGRFDRLLVSPLTREHRRPEGDGFAARVYDQLFRQAASESDLAP